MTNDLQQARIEAAARAIYDEWRSPDYFTWEQAVEGRNANPDQTFPHIVDRFRGQARAALAAADAHLPSVEQIAEVIAAVIEAHQDSSGTHYPKCWKYHAGCLAVLLRDMGAADEAE